MNEGAITKWLLTVGSERAGRRAGWILGPCPLAEQKHEKGTDSNPSFGVELKPGESRVYCFSCGYGASQTGLTMYLARHGGNVDPTASFALINQAIEDGELELEPGDYESNVFGKADDHFYPEWLLDALEPAYNPPEVDVAEVHPYLGSRAVSWLVAEKLDIRYDSFRDRIVFPVRDFQGRLRGLHGRACGDDDLKYLMYQFQERTNPHVWLGEHLLPEDDEKPIVIAESCFDMARALELYPHVASPLKAMPSLTQLKRFDFLKRIVTLFDGDKAGDTARMKLRSVYPAAEIVDVIPETDAADMKHTELEGPLLEAIAKVSASG